MTETAREIEVISVSGAICKVGGPYRSSRNARVVILMRPGDEFPPDSDGAKTEWSYITERVSRQ